MVLGFGVYVFVLVKVAADAGGGCPLREGACWWSMKFCGRRPQTR